MSGPASRNLSRVVRLLCLAGVAGVLGLTALAALKWRGMRAVRQAWEEGAYLAPEKDPALGEILLKMTPKRRAKVTAFRKAASDVLRSDVWPAHSMVEGKDGTLLYKGCLRCANAPTSAYLAKVPLFQEMARLLASRGIQLVVVPVPSAYGIHSERLPGLTADDAPLAEDTHPQLRAFCQSLEKSGIRVVDPCMTLRQAALEGQICYYTYDSHWSPIAATATAKLLARALSPVPGASSLSGAFSSHEAWVPQMHGSPHDGAQVPPPLAVRAIQGTTISAESPIVVLADSNGLDVYDSGDTPPQQIRCGISSQIALELQQPIDLIYHAGGGPYACRADFVRRCRSKPGYLQAKRTLIWCLAERALLLPMDAWQPLGINKLEPPAVEPPSPEFLKKAPARAQVRIIAATPTINPTETPYSNVVLAHTAELVNTGADPKFRIVMWLDLIRARRPVANPMPKPGSVIWVDLTDMDLAKVKHPHLQVCEYRDGVEDFTFPAFYATPVAEPVE